MLPQRALVRSAQRFSARAPARLPKRHSSTQTTFTGAEDNAFNRERAAVKQHAADSSDLWRKLSLYVAIPCLIVASANAYTLWHEHWEHEAHRSPPEERPQYEYMNVRNKLYPWGDGNKTLFWNDKINYLKKDE